MGRIRVEFLHVVTVSYQLKIDCGCQRAYIKQRIYLQKIKKRKQEWNQSITLQSKAQRKALREEKKTQELQDRKQQNGNSMSFVISD